MLFPKMWTMGQSLTMCRQSISLMLMVLIAVLDLTVDAAEKDEDQFSNLKNCLEKQKVIFNKCVACKV